MEWVERQELAPTGSISINEVTTPQGDVQMADTTFIPQPVTGTEGFGGTLGAILIGSMMGRNGGLFGGGYGTGMGAVAGAELAGGYNPVLQALNQQQLASATQIMTQDINRIGHDVATSAAATQATVANANLGQTVATLQGQTALTSSIADSTLGITTGTANLAANLNSAVSGIGSDITSGIYNLGSQLSSGLNALGSAIGADAHMTQDLVNRSTNLLSSAINAAEVNQLKSSFELQRTITADGDRTRDLVTRNEIDRLNREILEAREDRRHDNTVSALTINNNANANAVATQSQQQQQAQQINLLANGLSSVLSSLNHLNQVTITNGNRNNVAPVATNVV